MHLNTSITDVDFGGLNFKEFIYILEDVTKGKCPDVYYCLAHKSLGDGLRPLTNDDDYTSFLMLQMRKKKKKKVLTVDSESSDEDKDSVMSDAISFDHEPDEEIMEPNKPQFILFMTQLKNGIHCNPSLV
ncbi:unnamed protein product [Lactuca virosa]|uniref:Uncharacterized protein n=1 Tax=Lactuca virosa TaxID=75947 RepID=A0AAU9PLA1_9ASTR|nr:unnamed protein product [Lactuca virosa]